ncbi:MAG: alpha-ketoglutarate-dependent dioxygenase AlkB, partial [Allomuricauda sp.]
TYSGLTMHPLEFTHELAEIKELVEKAAKSKFTTCLLNYYRDGKDSNGWHSDDEKELGTNPIIASVSFGAERFFHLRNKMDKTRKLKILLENGSLLLMKGKTQHHWQHQIPKTAKPIGGRINLTFRILK